MQAPAIGTKRNCVVSKPDISTGTKNPDTLMSVMFSPLITVLDSFWMAERSSTNFFTLSPFFQLKQIVACSLPVRVEPNLAFVLQLHKRISQ